MNILTLVIVAGAVLTFSAYLLLRFSRQFARLSNAFVRLPASQKVVLILGVTIATVSAQKGGTNDVDGTSGGGTNAPPLLQFVLPPSTPAVAISSNDVLRGYRLESVSLNPDVTYAMPDGAAVVGTWHLTGAYEDVVRVGIREQGLGISGWSFPLGTHLCDSLWSYTWGKVRPQLKNASNEIAAVGAPMSAIPGVSRFWTAATTNGSRLLTWENFVQGRVREADVDFGQAAGKPLPPYLSAQIELFPNGDFIARSNEVESVYRRVIAPNPIGPDNPEDPDNPLMPIHPYGPVQDLSVIGESNAYCWVDIVVQADAWVRFEGDGPSNLSDPSFAAKAGETNQVVILIGKTYKVTCDMPFEVVGKSSGVIDEWWEDERTLWLNWPVQIWAQGDDEDMPLLLFAAGFGSPRGDGFTMHVNPSNLGGLFNWTNSCCSVSGSGMHFSYGCDEFCLCGGCSALGYYGYEGYRIGCNGGWCGCSWYDDDDPDDDDPDDPPAPVGVSVCFSKSAIIFEDAYQATSNLTVQLRSTTTELCLSAHGGDYGGSVMFTATGIDNRLTGGLSTFPLYRQLAAGETFSVTNVYTAIAQSGSAEDIVVTGTFIENETDWSDTDEDKATAIRVQLNPAKQAPENGSSGRHKFGVYEVINCHQYPSSPQLTWNVSAGTMFESNSKYRCPLDVAVGNPITISCGGAEFTPIISVVTPNLVVARDVGYDDFDAPIGEAGSIALVLSLYIGPFDVNFTEIAVEEVPDSNGVGSGYFGRKDMVAWTSHTIVNGSGRWLDVGGANKMGDLEVYDQAGVTETLSRMNSSGLFVDDPNCGWQHGTIDMPNPFGWNVKGTTAGQPVARFAESTRDFIELQDYGKCSVLKLQNEVYRLTNGCVYLNGVLQP